MVLRVNRAKACPLHVHLVRERTRAPWELGGPLCYVCGVKLTRPETVCGSVLFAMCLVD